MPSQMDRGAGLALSSFTHWFAWVPEGSGTGAEAAASDEVGAWTFGSRPLICFVPPADSVATGSEKKARREAAAAATKAAKAALAANR